MRRWHIVVEAEDGRREPARDAGSDLGEVTRHALALADMLGRIPAVYPRDCRVDIVSDSGAVELAITIIPGGLDPRAA